MLECIQEPGEALFVPHGWGHGVLNLETSIGAAMELEPKGDDDEDTYYPPV